MAVLFLHASGLSSRQWRRWLPHFEDARAIDRSEVPGVDRLQHDRSVVADALGSMGPAHLVGHSYGGVLALQTACDHPRYVRSVTVYEPPLTSLLATGDEHDRALLAASHHDRLLDAAWAGSEGWIAAFVDWWNGPSAYAALPAPSRAELLRTAPEAAREVLSLARCRRALKDYRALSCPVLLLRGDRTPAPIAAALDRLGTLPSVHTVVLSGVGHMAPLTDADRLIPLVQNFLKEVTVRVPGESDRSADNAASPRSPLDGP